MRFQADLQFSALNQNFSTAGSLRPPECPQALVKAPMRIVVLIRVMEQLELHPKAK
jgi:hypothetical protein